MNDLPILPAPVGPSPAADPWLAWADEVRRCDRCALAKHRTQVVLYRGARRPRVAFVGEAPGKEEDLRGVPFVGRAGRLLDAAIATLPLRTAEFGVLNVVKCRPPNNRLPAFAVQACRPFLERQLELLDPRVLVSLGAHALTSLDPSAPPITQAAGRPRALGTRTLFPLVHPAATFRARRYAERWQADIARLGRWLDGRDLETL